MVFGRSPAVGLDIGSSSVKVVQLRRSGSNIELEKFGMAEVTQAGDAVAAKTEAIKRAMANAQISSKQVVTAVSGESIIVRYLQLPKMPESELRSALRFEAEEYIPYNLDDVYLDSDILGETSDESGEKVDVLLVCAKKDLIQEHASMLRAAGLTPEIIDLDSFAFFNCFERNYQPPPDEVYGLVNIGCQVTNVNIVHDGASRFSRDIGIAGNTITTTIQTKLGLDAGQAEDLKIREGLAEVGELAPERQEEDSNLLDTIRGTVERITEQDLGDEDTPEAVAQGVAQTIIGGLINEIRRSLQFYESQPNARAITRVVLGGGTARLRNLESFFQRELGLPVEMMDPLSRISLGGRKISAADLADNKAALGVGIGLALRKVGE